MNAPATKQLLTQIQQASQHIRNGRQAEAMLIYDEVAQRAGDDIAANVQLGHLSSELGKVEQAIEHYRLAVSTEPENAHFLSFLGVALQQNDQPDEAFEIFNRAAESDTELPSVYQGLGRISLLRADYVRAKEHFEKAGQLKPSDASVQVNLATTLVALNEHESALEHAQTALKLDASNPNSHYAVGKILSQLGRNEDAVRQFETLIRKHRKFGAAYDFLARIKKFSQADSGFIGKTEKVLQQGMPAEQRFCVHYALGKMYDDCGNWNKAFKHYSQANLLQKKAYSIKPEKKSFKQIKKDYGAAALKANRERGHESEQPVFVVGMPRSGTTLLEQIIASHPQAVGAGELPEMPRIAQSISPSDDFRKQAEGYLAVLRQGRGDATRIVDKLPDNFFYLGIVASLFPNATIIHALRHPLDTCLSCYFQNFTNVRWACDLELIGERYLFYREIMDYWRSVLPEGKIVDISYEKLIDDPKSQGQRMVEACGLNWDDKMLQFHDEDRIVKSASLWQVRQPIYRSSRMRWKNYASHLGMLADALSPYLQDDREELAENGITLSTPSAMGRLKKLIG